MIKNRLIWTMMIGMATLLSTSSCHDADEETAEASQSETSLGERVPVVFNIPYINIVTRATDTSFEVGDALSVFAVDRSATGTDMLDNTNYAQNVKYVNSSSGFVAANEPIWQYRGETLRRDLIYYVIYPYKAMSYYGTSFPEFIFGIGQDQTSHDKYTANDLSIKKLASKSTNVELALDHMLTNIEIVITGISTPFTNASATLYSLRNRVKVQMNKLDEPNPITNMGGGYISDIYCEKLDQTATGCKFHAIVAPQQILQGQKLVVLNIDGNIYNLKATSQLQLASGKQYTFTYDLGGSSIRSDLGIGYGGTDDDGSQTPSSRVTTSVWE